MPKLICPECGAEMMLRVTKKFTYKSGEPRKFYGCERWPECKATHGAHPDGSPLGKPANQETKNARIKAHEAFDDFFKDVSKSKAYCLLQTIMGMTPQEAHIANFDITQCELLIHKIAEARTNK